MTKARKWKAVTIGGGDFYAPDDNVTLTREPHNYILVQVNTGCGYLAQQVGISELKDALKELGVL